MGGAVAGGGGGEGVVRQRLGEVKAGGRKLGKEVVTGSASLARVRSAGGGQVGPRPARIRRIV
jgi:hypothetical protein